MAGDIGYKLEISGSGDKPIFRIENDSESAKITAFTATIGEVVYDFADVLEQPINTPAITSTLEKIYGDELKWTFEEFKPGFFFQRLVDLSYSNDYREIVFDVNGFHETDNSFIIVEFDDGTVLSGFLPDFPENNENVYTFSQDNIPLPKENVPAGQVGYKLEISGTGDKPVFRIENESESAKITAFTATIGEVVYDFADVLEQPINTPAITSTLEKIYGDELKWTFEEFKPGFFFQRSVDLSYSNDYRQVIFDLNGSDETDNSFVTVDFDDGTKLFSFLPDFPENEDGVYTFTQVNNPVVPDLQGKYFDIKEEPDTPGNSFNVEFEVENTQAADAGSYTVAFYLSKNPWISSDDHKLGEFTVDELGANSSTGILNKNLTLPGENDAFWEIGDGDNVYYVGAIVDANGEVSEVNENNNASLAKFLDFDDIEIKTSAPDLIGKSFNIEQENIKAGDTINIEFEVQNTQSIGAGFFLVDFYVSDNSYISNNDKYLGSYRVQNLEGNSNTDKIQFALVLPNESDSFWQSGDGDNLYSIGMVIDADNFVSETDKKNNASRGNLLDFEEITIDVGGAVNGVSEAGFTQFENGLRVDNGLGFMTGISDF